MTTIWCEVTSSIRSRGPDNEDISGLDDDSKKPPPSSTATKEQSLDEVASAASNTPQGGGELTELLLCLRPIRDGEVASASKELRLRSGSKRTKKTAIAGEVTSGTSGATTSEERRSSPTRPLKKRRPQDQPEEGSKRSKRQMICENGEVAEETLPRSTSALL